MKRVSLKKCICLFLTVVLAALLVVPSLAAADTAKNPILIVSGFAEYELSDRNSGTVAFPGDTDAIVSTVTGALPPLLTLLASGKTQADYDAFCDAALPVVNQMFDSVACNPDGTVKYPDVGLTHQFPEAVSTYGISTVMQGAAFDKDLLLGAVDAVGADNVFVYGLDWRLDPLYVADELNDWVHHIQDVTGAAKVSITGISMGGVMVSTYLAKYGTADISNVTMISSAFTGLAYLGRLFKGEVVIDEQGLYNMINQAVGTDVLSSIIGSTGLVRQIIGLVDDLYAAEQDRLFTECLMPAFGYNPGLWSFVPAADYEDAKAFMFSRMDSTDTQKATLEAKLDAYHEIQSNAKQTLQNAKAAGVKVAIVSNYNFQMPPVSSASALTGDQVIETVHTSAFATCANQGETLPASVRDSRHVSADRMIDASTCWFPENTWFIKNMQHVGFSNAQNQCKFYNWLLTADKQRTVTDNADYPQFMLYNAETQVLTPLAMQRGDVNFDGRVNLIDARLVLRHVRTISTLSAVAKEAADMNGDSRLTHTDVQLIMDTYAGLAPADAAPAVFAADEAQQKPASAAAAQEDAAPANDGLQAVAEQLSEAVDNLKGTLLPAKEASEAFSQRIAERLSEAEAAAPVVESTEATAEDAA